MTDLDRDIKEEREDILAMRVKLAKEAIGGPPAGLHKLTRDILMAEHRLAVMLDLNS